MIGRLWGVVAEVGEEDARAPLGGAVRVGWWRDTGLSLASFTLVFDATETVVPRLVTVAFEFAPVASRSPSNPISTARQGRPSMVVDSGNVNHADRIRPHGRRRHNVAEVFAVCAAEPASAAAAAATERADRDAYSLIAALVRGSGPRAANHAGRARRAERSGRRPRRCVPRARCATTASFSLRRWEARRSSSCSSATSRRSASTGRR